MPLSHVPLWKQLIIVWVSALVLDAFIFWLQFRRPFKVFWLIPYPNVRLIWPGVVQLFQDYPLLGLAIVTVPILAVLFTIALCANRVLSR